MWLVRIFLRVQYTPDINIWFRHMVASEPKKKIKKIQIILHNFSYFFYCLYNSQPPPIHVMLQKNCQWNTNAFVWYLFVFPFFNLFFPSTGKKKEKKKKKKSSQKKNTLIPKAFSYHGDDLYDGQRLNQPFDLERTICLKWKHDQCAGDSHPRGDVLLDS